MPRSLAEIIGELVNDLTQISADELRDWSSGLPLPPGWQSGRIEGASSGQPSRVAVCGQRPDGGWYGCETLNVYRFSGPAPITATMTHTDCTLRDLGADSVANYRLGLSETEGVAAARSSGYFSAAGLRFWAQYSTYIRGERAPFDGLLIYQALIVAADRRGQLGDDIAELGDAMHIEFLDHLATVDDVCRSLMADSEVLRDGS